MGSGIRNTIMDRKAAFNNMKEDISLTKIKASQVLHIFCFVLWCRGLDLWNLRRILKISWTEHITNMEVMQRLGKEKQVVFTVKKRKLEYYGHILRHEKYRLLQLVAQGKVDSRRGPGRRRHWLHNLRQWFGLSSVDLFRSAVNKMLIANVLNG